MRMPLSAWDLGHPCGRVRRIVDPAEVVPQLPTRSEFARMVNRRSDTAGFRTLHATIVGHFLAVQRLPPAAVPSQGAIVPLPDVAPARKRLRMADHVGLTWEEAMDREIEVMAVDRHRQPHGRGVAVRRDIHLAADDA